jgi:hypothetical protein
MRFLYHRRRGRLENICVEWHFRATDTTNGRLAALRSRIDPPQSAFPQRAVVTHASMRDKEHLMLDIVVLALGLGFFVMAVGYAYACERL